MKTQQFEREIKIYAKQREVDSLTRKVEKCATQDKTVLLMDRLENMITQVTQRVNSDFTTKDQVNEELHKMNMKMTTEFTRQKDTRDFKAWS